MTASAGINANGAAYVSVIPGDVVDEGVDGDVSFTPVPGWQLIGNWYAGHQRDPFGKITIESVPTLSFTEEVLIAPISLSSKSNVNAAPIPSPMI